MRKVKDAVDLTTNEKIYFKGHAKATYLSDGRNVEEALGEIPSAESSVFEAIPEVTPYEDILAAYEANKHIICKRFNYTYSVVRFYNNKFYFSCISEAYANTMTCDSLNRWVFLGYEVEKASNKVKTINAESTDTQYPSAKAVYDFVNNTLGVIINGDY